MTENLHDLPGTDPRFHEARKYLSPVKVRGEEILAAFGSCKEEGCNYRAAWNNSASRDRNMWLHRAMKVREARMLYFIDRFGDKDPAYLGQLFLETSDMNTHYYNPWLDVVKKLYRDLAGDKTLELPEYDYYVEYKAGKMAKDTVNFIFEAVLR